MVGQTTQYKIQIVIEEMFKGMGTKKALNSMNQFQQKLTAIGSMSRTMNVGKRLGIGFKEGRHGLELYDLKSKKVFANQVEAIQRVHAAMNRTKVIQPPFGGKAGTAGFGDVSKMMKTNLQFEELQKNARLVGLEVRGSAKSMSVFQNGIKLTGETARQGFMKIGRNAERMQGQFDMSMLSIMFFGMAMQRMFSGLMRMGITTYKELTKNNTEASTAVTHLEANMQLLKFTLGEALVSALLPYMDTIVNLITALAAWISKHQKLVAWILIVGAALGTFLFVLGTVKLGLGAIGLKLGDIVVWFKNIANVSSTAGGILTNFARGVATAFKSMWVAISSLTKQFFTWLNGILMKSSLWVNFSQYVAGVWKKLMIYLSTAFGITSKMTAAQLAQLSGKFVAFGAMGYLVGKLIHNGLSSQFSNFFMWAGKRWAAFTESLVEYWSQSFNKIASSLQNVGKAFAALTSGNFQKAASYAKSAINDIGKFKFQRGGKSFSEMYSENLGEANEAQNFTDELFVLQKQLLNTNTQYEQGTIILKDYQKQIIQTDSALKQLNSTYGTNVNVEALRGMNLSGATEFAKQRADLFGNIASAIALIGGSAAGGMALASTAGITAATGALGAGVGAALATLPSVFESFQTYSNNLDNYTLSVDKFAGVADEFSNFSPIISKITGEFGTMHEDLIGLREEVDNITSKEQEKLNVIEEQNIQYEKQLALLDQMNTTIGNQNISDIIEEHKRYINTV